MFGKKLRCPACGSENVSVQVVQEGSKTRHKGPGLGGHLNNTARGVVGLATLGTSNLVWKKSKGSSSTTVKNGKVAICQNCGHSWKVL